MTNKNYFESIKYSPAKNVKLLTSGKSYLNEFINLIESAKKSIILQVYILEADSSGQKVIKALINAAKRGVYVYVLVDAIGSSSLDPEVDSYLKNYGVSFTRFNSLFNIKNFNFGRRAHQKVLIIDSYYCILSGLNLSNDYLLETCQERPWLDLGVKFEGKIVKRITKKAFEIHKRWSFNCPKLPLAKVSDTSFQAKSVDVHFVENDGHYGVFKIHKSYFQAIRSARKDIKIINGYFLPSPLFLKHLVNARKRGVSVTMIFPRLSDVPLYKWALETLYTYLLKNEIEIYEWTKSVLHAKAALVDFRWSTIGSYNLNYTSRLGNIEMNLEIFNNDFSNDLNKFFKNTIDSGCEKICSEMFKQRSTLLRARNFLAFILVKVISSISIFFMPRNRLSRKHWSNPSNP